MIEYERYYFLLQLYKLFKKCIIKIGKKQYLKNLGIWESKNSRLRIVILFTDLINYYLVNELTD